MRNLERFVRPGTLRDLLEAKKNEPDNVVLAGGTSLVFSKDPNIKVLIDMRDVPELKEIRWDGDDLVLGAMVTMTRIRKDDSLPQMLREAALAVASTPIRNVVTVGGEIMRGVYWTDLPVALLAMDGVAVFSSVDGERSIPLQELYESHPTKVIQAHEILREVRIPSAAAWRGKFLKFSKTATDYALASVAVTVEPRVRVAVGAVTPLPRRLMDVEALLSEKGDGALGEIDGALQGLQWRPDFRISREYQQNLVSVGIRRAFRAVSGGEG